MRRWASNVFKAPLNKVEHASVNMDYEWISTLTGGFNQVILRAKVAGEYRTRKFSDLGEAIRAVLKHAGEVQ